MTENFGIIEEWILTQLFQYFFLCVLGLSVWLGVVFYRDFKESGQGFKEYISSLGIYYYQLLTIKGKPGNE